MFIEGQKVYYVHHRLKDLCFYIKPVTITKVSCSNLEVIDNETSNNIVVGTYECFETFEKAEEKVRNIKRHIISNIENIEFDDELTEDTMNHIIFYLKNTIKTIDNE